MSRGGYYIENLHVSLSDLHQGQTTFPFYLKQLWSITGLLHWHKAPGSRLAARPPDYWLRGLKLAWSPEAMQYSANLTHNFQSSMRPRMRVDIRAKRPGPTARAAAAGCVRAREKQNHQVRPVVLSNTKNGTAGRSVLL